MKERPILFQAEMIRALIAGTKTQTRRIVKLPVDLDSEHPGAIWELAKRPESWGPQDETWSFIDQAHPTESYPYGVRCPHGVIGDRLWCRETWCVSCCYDSHKPSVLTANTKPLGYFAGGGFEFEGGTERGKWRPSIFMPRWASRITLEIVNVRVERVQSITEADAIAEGVGGMRDMRFATALGNLHSTGHRLNYAELWDTINGAGSWESNCWVWVISFKVLPS